MTRCLLAERVDLPRQLLRWGNGQPSAAVRRCVRGEVELITSCVASLRRGAVDEVARHARVRAIWPMRLA